MACVRSQKLHTWEAGKLKKTRTRKITHTHRWVCVLVRPVQPPVNTQQIFSCDWVKKKFARLILYKQCHLALFAPMAKRSLLQLKWRVRETTNNTRDTCNCTILANLIALPSNCCSSWSALRVEASATQTKKN